MGRCKGCGRRIDIRTFCNRCRADRHAIRRVKRLMDERQLSFDDLSRESLDIGLAALEHSSRRKENTEAISRLEPLARDLAFEAGPEGIIVADLREAAEARGLGLPRTLASLGCVMRRAGLVSTEDYRRSHIAESHRNLQRVWVDGRYVE